MTTLRVAGTTTLPPWLWGAGATAIGDTFPRDKARCSDCGKLSRRPTEYELGRLLCPSHQQARAAIAYAWVESRRSGP